MNKFERYSRILPWCMAVLLSALVVGCGGGGGGGGQDPILGSGGVAPFPPTVTAVAPVNNANGVPISNTLVTAAFSKDMNPATITASTFTLSCPVGTPVTGSVVYTAASRVATFTPTSSLPASTICTATVTTGATDTTGLTLVSNFVWTFTTGVAPDTTRPRVALTIPATTIPGPTLGVPTNTAITAVFSEEMAPATINAASFTVTCAAPCVSPAGTVSYAVGSRTATFMPAAALAITTTYTVTITTAATDLAGNQLAGNQAALPAASNYVWTFTTGGPIINPPTPGGPQNVSVLSTFPSVGATDFCPSASVIATFNVPSGLRMDPLTVTPTTFTVTGPAPAFTPVIAESVVLDAATGRVATFKPRNPLTSGVTYTVTIKSGATGVKDLASPANTMVNDFVSTFTVAPATGICLITPPGQTNISVLSTNPAAGATGVCPNASINGTFGVPSGLRMDALSVTTATFTVTGPAPSQTPVVASSVVLDAATGRIATFTPMSALVAGVTYTATIRGGTNGVRDLAIPANTMAANFAWNFTVASCLPPPPPPVPISLGSASPFGTFGGSAGMTNQGLLTIINGDIGTTAVSTAVTGFHDAGPGCTYTETPLNFGTVNGKIYTAAPPPTPACPSEGTATTFAIATQARADALAAYNALVAQPGGSDPGAGNLGSLVLAPGVYTAASGSFRIQGGNLTLDAQGNANAVWVFQMATTLTVGGPGAAFPQSVILANGAQAKNVFWQVGSAATINAGGGGTMVGTIISQAGVTFSTAGNVTIVTLNGRALSLGASVTMVNTVINVPAP